MVRMNRGVQIVPALIAVLWLLSAAWAESPPTATPMTQPAATDISPQRMAALIEQLGDDNPAKREQASQALAEIGMEAIPALQRAAENDDPEIAARARQLLKSIPRSAVVTDACLRWTTQLPDGFNRGLVLTRTMACLFGGDDKLHGFALSDGKPTWEHAVAGTEKLRLGAIDDTLIFLPHSSDKFGPTAFDAATGKVLWEGKDRALAASVVGENQVVYVHEGTITSLTPDGAFRWRQTLKDMDIGDFQHPNPLGITTDACLFVLGSENEKTRNRAMLLALAPVTGEKLWSTTYLSEQYRTHGIGGGRIFLAMQNGTKVYDLKTGKAQDTKLWSELGNLDNPMVVDGKYLLCGLVDRLTGHDIENGRQLWQHEVHRCGAYGPDALNIHGFKDGAGTGASVVAVHDGEVLCGIGGELVALNIQTGEPTWKYAVPGVIVSVPIVRDGIAYFIIRGAGEGVPVAKKRPPDATPADAETADEKQPQKPFGDSKNVLYALDLARVKQLGLAAED